MVHWVYHVPNGRHIDGIIYRFIGLTFQASKGLSGLVINPDVKIIFSHIKSYMALQVWKWDYSESLDACSSLHMNLQFHPDWSAYGP